MKKIFLASIICLAALQLHSQTTSIIGQIINPKSPMVYLRHYSDYITYDEVIIDSATLDEKGMFLMEFERPKAGYATFYHGDEITGMYVSPGDQLQLTLDTREFDESIRYAGPGARANNYMAQKYLQTPPMTQEIYTYAPEAFAAYMDSTQALQLALCEKTFADQSILSVTEKQFLETERSSIRYEAANQKLNFPAYHGYVSGNRGYKAPPEYYAFLDAIPLVDENAIASSRYLEFLSSFVDYKVKEAMTAAPESDGNAVRNAFIDSHWKGYLRDYLHAKRIHQWLDAGSMDIALGMYATVKPTMTTPAFIAMLDKTIAARQQLAPGNPAPHFAARDLDGNSVDLTTYKGKVIYIDIWATWCGPCLGEIPAMDKLIHEMDGKDVVFLGVSVDENEDAWQKMLKDKNMMGVHIIAPGNFESSVAKAYQVRGIPHYVLIDKHGNIANANAPRPGAVKEALEKLIAE